MLSTKQEHTPDAYASSPLKRGYSIPFPKGMVKKSPLKRGFRGVLKSIK